MNVETWMNTWFRIYKESLISLLIGKDNWTSQATIFCRYWEKHVGIFRGLKANT